MIPIDQLFRAQTREEVRETMLATLESYGIPARSWYVGGALSVMLTVVSAVVAGLTSIMVDAIRATFLDTATGVWLTMLARYVYGVDRLEASFASGLIRFDNTSATPHSKAIGEVRVVNPTTRKTYTNTEPLVVGALATNVLVAFQAVEQGAASSSAAATITGIETTMIGVTCTNPAALIGADAQSDPSLRQDCRDKLATLSPNGPRAAYAYFARRAPRLDGSRVDINRVTVSKDSSTGVVTVYVASPSGAPLVADVTAVQEYLNTVCVPDAQRVDVFGAVPVVLTLPSVAIYARKESGQTAPAIQAAAAAALVELQREYPIGGLKKIVGTGYLFGDKVSGTIVATSPAIFDVDGIGPDLALAANEVPIINATITVNLVSGVS